MTPRRAFTLTELLMVIVIISGLVALTIPAISMVQTLAKKRTSASNLRQIHAAMMVYRDENDNLFPAKSVRGSTIGSASNQYKETVGAFERLAFYSGGNITGSLFRCPASEVSAITAMPNAACSGWNGQNVSYAYDWAAPGSRSEGLRVLVAERDAQYWGRITTVAQSSASGVQTMTVSGELGWMGIAATGNLNTLCDDGATLTQGSIKNIYYPNDSYYDRINGHAQDDTLSALRNGALINQYAVGGGSATRVYLK